jgi:protoporphyrinogen/coproporphyrinogen III oxidase
VSPRRPTVVVVGAGIAGLAAAWELVAGGNGADRGRPDVVVLEESDRIGGKLLSGEFAGRTVDLAADAFLARRPEATELCAELGLDDELVPVGASGASIWARGRLRAMPPGLQLGVPTRWWPVARSGLLSAPESLRVARDLFSVRLVPGTEFGDRSVGDIVGERLGRPVVDRLVDPLIGGINAGGVDHLSAAATFPFLLAAARQPGSLMHRLGKAAAPAQVSDPDRPDRSDPVFWSLAGSTADLARATADALIERGATIRTGASVEAVERTGSGRSGSGRSGGSRSGAGRSGPGPWRLHLGSGPALRADAVVLAVPAPRAAVLLASITPEAAGALSTIAYASVAVVTLSLPERAIRAELAGTGFLVPRTSTIDGRPALLTGCTYLDRKWPHLARPGDQLVRASVGRWGDHRQQDLDDDELTASVVGELAHLIDLDGTPLASLVTRWDDAFPQYDVGHLVKVGAIEKAVRAQPGLAVAGAAFRGVGIPACIGSGRTAARDVLASLALEHPADHGRSAAPEPGR